MEQIIPTNCPYCQSSVNHILAGVSKRTGKPYNEFWACENRDCKFTWHPNKKPQTRRPEQPDPMLLILDETRKINERLDKMADFLADKLGK